MDTEQDSSPAADDQKAPLWNRPEQDLANGNMQVDDVSYIPAEMKRHLDFIDIKQGKHTVFNMQVCHLMFDFVFSLLHALKTLCIKLMQFLFINFRAV